MSDPEPGPRYRFGPLERRGLVAGWRGGQIAALAGGLVAAVFVLRGHPTPAGVAGAVTVVAVSIGVASWPLGGRTAEQWAPDALRHARTSLASRARDRVRPFAALEVLAVDAGAAGRCGVVHDERARTYTTVLQAWGSGFILLGAADKALRVDSWSTALSGLCRQGSAVQRLQWVARCLPDDGSEVRRYWQSAGVMDPASTPQLSYAALLRQEAAATHRREVLLAITVDAGRAGRAQRARRTGPAGRAGGTGRGRRSGRRDACTVAVSEAARVRRQLADAGIATGGILDPSDLKAALRRGWDDLPGSERVSGHSGWPWPMAVRPEWGQVLTDASWHATYWVSEWPRRDVGPEFLGPLVLCDVRCAVALVMEPMSASDAARRVEQSRTADIADAELRRRGGFLATARRRREEDGLAQREQELADGHGQYRFSAYVTVTASDPESLEEHCARVEQAAARSGLELRRCYGDQAQALTCTLPLGRGLA